MRRALLILIALMITAPAFGRVGLRDDGDYVPQVVLTRPTEEKADITGKAALKFEWSPHESAPGMREYYDFRLYKGYDMYENSLIRKERLGPDVCSIDIGSEVFQDGQVYTWSVRQVYDRARKSGRSYKSFTVIKK